MTTRATSLSRALVALVLAALHGTCSAAGPSGGAAGGGADPTIRFLEARVKQDPLDYTAHDRLAGSYIRLMRDTGDLAYLDKAAVEARASLAAVSAPQNPGGLAALALVEFESHHFAEALDLARRAHAIDPRNSGALATEGDAQLELGNYDEARAIYARLTDAGDSPPIVARRARLAELMGDNAGAIELLSGVADGGAWFHVRLGELYFRTGSLEKAEAQYQAALQQVPESFLALEHLAELRAAQGRYDDSVALYGKVIARVPRAEYLQAMGDVEAFRGKADAAKPWHDRALAAYLASVAAGNAHYYHHLATFYSDVEENPAEALRWARKDIEVRHSIQAQDCLAWALYKNGSLPEAREAMKKALALGTQDAHLLFHAGMIASRAGDLAAGREYLRQALAIDPAYNAFHVHR